MLSANGYISNPKCVVLLQSSEECHITFSFVEHSSVVVSTLTLRWRGSRGHLPAAHWNTQLVSLPELGLRENDLLHIQGTLISRYDCLDFYTVLRQFCEKFVKYSYLIRCHTVFLCWTVLLGVKVSLPLLWTLSSNIPSWCMSILWPVLLWGPRCRMLCPNTESVM